MSILTVGPTGEYKTISAAVAASHSGDIIQVAAGTYTNDFPPLINHNLSLVAVGGRVSMVATVPPPNGKAIIDEGGSGVTVTVTGFDFSGAVVPDGNGAGIRYEGGNFILKNDYFYNNQEGLLAASDPNGTMVVANTEFSHNGSGTGYTHNLYVNGLGALDVLNSYFTGAVVGHEIKSRALNTTVVNTRVQDGPTGTASYGIDLPNGGRGLIVGDTIEKGPNSQNHTMIPFGEEGGVYPSSSLTVASDALLNDAPNVLGAWNNTAATAQILGDKFWRFTTSQIASGPAHIAGAHFLSSKPALNTSAPFTTNGYGVRIVEPSGSITTSSTGSTLVVMNGGSESVTAAGYDTVMAGSGADTIQAGANHVWVVGGTGSLTFRGGSGTASITLEPAGTHSNVHLDGAGTVTLAGAATVAGGSGADLYELTNGYASTDLIENFQIGTDHLRLIGFPSTAGAQALAGQTDTTAGIVLHLSDGTVVTLAGIHGTVGSTIFG